MSTPQPQMSRSRIASILWFPIFFAIVLPLAFEVVYHQPQPHNVQIAVVGPASQVTQVAAELRHVSPGGFDVRQLPSPAAAAEAVRGREVAAAYVSHGATGAVYLARAAGPIRANYLQGVFAGIASATGHQPPPIVDLVPVAPGDTGTGVFFFVFPLMMAGVITAIVLLQLPTFRIGRRALAVAGIGAIGTAATYLTAIRLNMIPDKPLLLVYAFVLTQVFGQLMVGAAPLLKQYFLPFSLTFALILSVPSSGGTMTPDILPTLFRYLNDALPMAQTVDAVRSVAYFQNADLTRPTLLIALWAAIAAGVLSISWLRQPPRPRHAAAAKRPSLATSQDLGPATGAIEARSVRGAV